mgnify:CR=1 FL=1|jgi:hypothetical protein
MMRISRVFSHNHFSLGSCFSCSDLVTCNASFELDLAEPVIEGGLGLVPSEAVHECSAAHVHVHWFVQEQVDDLFLKASAAGHLY